MDDKKRKVLVVFILLFSMLTSSFGYYIFSILKYPNILVDKDDRYIYIEPNTSFNALRDSLVSQGVVNDLKSFAYTSKFMKYQSQVKPGRYLLKKDMTSVEAVRLLRSGEQEPINIRFSNARYLTELAGNLTNEIIADSIKMHDLLQSDSIASSYGFSKETFISMFLPNTYQLFWLSDEKNVLGRMKREYNLFWTEERVKKAEAIGMSKIEVSILASIVDAETAMSDEKPRVAGAYINRLRKNMRLQADPTLIFGIGDFTIKRVLDEHKLVDSPYNTYKFSGLPPGPIRLSSISGIDAVLNFEEHDYLYFCAKEDFSGYHNFAKTYAQHQRNADKYHRAMNRNRVYK